MLLTGRCPNHAGCLHAFRNELISLPDDVPFSCPECGHLLVPAPAGPGRTAARVIPLFILGGISLLVIMGSAAVYLQVTHLRDHPAGNQIGTSFEQAQIAAEHGEFLPSRHMIAASPTPDTTGTMDAGAAYETPTPPAH